MVRVSNNGLQAPKSFQGTRRARRADARRRDILRAAAKVFRERGFAAAGMREIAAEADLSSGNLYHYFNGKDEILFYCQDRSLDIMMEALDSARVSEESATTQIGRVIDAHVHCLLDEIEGSAAHLEVDALPAGLRAKIVAKRDRYERGLRRLIAGGIRRGEIVNCDASLITRAILGAANWTARWFRPEGARSASFVAHALAEFMVRGLDGRVCAAAPKTGARRSRSYERARPQPRRVGAGTQRIADR